MTHRMLAARYARALLDVGIREADPRQIERELAEFAELVDAHPELGRVMLNPAVPVTRKRAAMTQLAARADLSPIVTRLLVLLAARDRLVVLPALVEAYRERLLDHLQVVRAEVTTAAPLRADRTEVLARSLSDLTGKHVSMVMRIDPAIIGGVVARVGSTVYDGSVQGQLARMKAKLTEES